MKRFLFLLLALGLSFQGFSQENTIQSATSAWVKVSIKAIPLRKPIPTIPIAFRETFDANIHSWREGVHGDYSYKIADHNYSIQRNRGDSKRTAYSYIPLPEEINLNKCDTFSVQVEIVGKPGTIPEGGLLLGMLDSLNYCQVRITDQRQVVVSMIIEGKVANRYFPGGTSSPQRSIQLEHNTLLVRRRDHKLHIYVNRQEISTSPFTFRYFRGNSIGLLTSGDAISFRNLLVRARPATDQTSGIITRHSIGDMPDTRLSDKAND